MFKNVASQKFIVFAFDSTTNLPKTGDAANITAYVSKDFGTVTALTDTSATEMDATNAKGYYLFDAAQAETNADILLVSAKSTTANIVVIGAPSSVFTVPPNFTTAVIDSSGRVDVGKVGGTAQTARDIGASVLLSPGTGTGQLDITTGVVKGNAVQILGTAVATPATAGVLDVNVKNMNNVAATSIATINANQGTTQPLNFTGTAGSALVKSDTVDIAGAAVSTSTAQIGTNVVNFGGSAGTFASGRPEVNTTHIAGTISPAVAGKVGIDFAQVNEPGAGTFLSAGIIDMGTAQSIPDSTHLQIRSLAAFGDHELKGATLLITSATTGALQRTLIDDNVGSTDTVSFVALPTALTGTVTYRIFGTPPASTASPAAVNVTQWNSTTVATPATAGIPDVNVKNIDNDAASASGTVTFPNATLASTTNITGGTMTTTTNLTNAPTSGDLTATMKASVTTAATAATPTISTLGANTITSASIANGAFSAAKFAEDTGIPPVLSGTATAGGSTSITLPVGAVGTNGYYNNDLVVITGGTGAGQAKFIAGYVGGTRVATVAAWAVNPDNTSRIVLLPYDAVAGASAPTVAQIATGLFQDLTSGTDFTTVGSFGKLIVDNINAAINSRMATYTQPTGFLAATFPTGTVANTTNITAGTMTTTTNLTNAPTSGDFTSTMKTSLNSATPVASLSGDLTPAMKTSVTTAATAATPTVAAVTAAVSVTGDLSATMKTSVITAATAATPTAAAVTGSVGSVAGNVGGSVASVTAPVSVTGDLSATMKTSVTTAATAATPTAAAVTGAVGSVAGNVGGSVAGSVGSVVAAVGIKKNAALANYPFQMTDSTNHLPATGLTVTAQRRLDNGSFAACANAVSEVSGGFYSINLASTDTNGDTIAFKFTAPGGDQLAITVRTQA